MISQITLKNFKSIKSAKLKLGPFNLFIGTNASGKSNFLDALRMLQGIAYGFTVDEVLNGKPKSDTSEVWERIRGGSQRATFGCSPESKIIPRVAMKVSLESKPGFPSAEYEVELNSRELAIRRERLTCGKKMYDSDPQEGVMPRNEQRSPVLKVWYNSTARGRKPSALPFEKSRAVLNQIWRATECDSSDGKIIRDVARRLSSVQKIDPQPDVLRGYSTSRSATRMGEKGENFAAVVKAICGENGDKELKQAYLSWLKELRPEEVTNVGWSEGVDGELMFKLTEGKADYPASVLSDGTLRFAAITAALFQPDMPKLMTIEEIENGVNPARMRVLMELVRHRAGQRDTQVIATTHSPLLLDWLTEEEWQYTFLCHRVAETGETKILPLTEIPRFNDVAKVGKVGELFSEGWLDFAL